MLWVTRTPLRVSLFGGGTDYPEYFSRRPGAVIGMAINQYIHIASLKLRAFQEYNYRVAYSKLEICDTADKVEHPVVRTVIQHYGIKDRLDISVASDLPGSGSGLGSSSAFTVGFLNNMFSMAGVSKTKIDLAREAIKVERNLLKENVGYQDQLHAAFGGINRFDFEGDRIKITPIQMASESLDALNAHLVLVHTGIARRSTVAAEAQIANTKDGTIDKDLTYLYSLVAECVSLLEGSKSDFLDDLGRMLSESWYTKRQLSTAISSGHIDEVFDGILAAGALGAKLCGAGGGGFFMALCAPERQAKLRDMLRPLAVIPISIDTAGTTLVYPALSMRENSFISRSPLRD